MQQLKLAFFLLFSWVLPALSVGKVTYYVQSLNPKSPCPGYPCKTLKYYFDNSDDLFYSGQHSTTMIFLEGNHVSDCSREELYAGTKFEMIGEYPDTVVYCMVVHFRNVLKLNIQQLKLVDCRARITPTELSSLISSVQVQISSVIVESSLIYVTDIAQVHIGNTSMELSSINIKGSTIIIEMKTCTFHNGFVTLRKTSTPNVTMEDCILVNNTFFSV